MKHFIENEIKLLIPESLYKKLYQTAMDLHGKTFCQTNYYFDTDNFLLAKNKCALRVREVNKSYIATLKTGSVILDQSLSSDEYNKTLTDSQAKKLLCGNIYITDVFPELIKMTGIKNEVVSYQGSLTTYRTVFQPIPGITQPELDRNIYHDVEDYELEWEYSEMIEYQTIMSWLQTYGLNPIDYPTKSKYGRFVDYLHLSRSH